MTIKIAMKTITIPASLLLILLLSCTSPPDEAQIEQWKNEIIQVEKDFSDLSVKEGVPKAFLTFAAENAVIKRGGELVVGKDKIRDRFSQQEASGAILEWVPDFVDVSKSGDLGYTYGSYTLTVIDSLGNEQQQTGFFHTVWKRQADGKWRFVYD